MRLWRRATDHVRSELVARVLPHARGPGDQCGRCGRPLRDDEEELAHRLEIAYLYGRTGG